MLLKICNKRKFRLNRNFLDTKYVFTDHVIFDRDEPCALFISSPLRKRAENPGNEVALLILVQTDVVLQAFSSIWKETIDSNYEPCYRDQI